MTQITAKIVADSVSEAGKRITTMELRYPRIIHGEFMTHRMFSRNARSSRAVPVKKMIEEVRDHPYIPIHFGKNQPGMQAREEHNALVMAEHYNGDAYWAESSPEYAWLQARDRAVEYAESFASAGYHKQIVNRLLEPFSHIDVLVTSTEWDNFYALRDHDDAQPEIRALAKAMRAAHDDSTPVLIQMNEWHLPYINKNDLAAIRHAVYPPNKYQECLRKLSVARCARISYAPFDGDASVEKELQRYESLVNAVPGHWSPAEHQATPDNNIGNEVDGDIWQYRNEWGNFIGWRQNRRILEN